MRTILTVLCTFLLSSALLSCRQPRGAEPLSYELVSTARDSVLAEKILLSLSSQKSKSTAELMYIAGKALLGQPYVANTLEGGDHEQLRVYLTKTDCIIFVETIYNLARTAKEGGTSFHDFTDNVCTTRYRGGVVRNYSDRVHYTTEWIRRNESSGLMKDITMDLGGEVYDHPIDFMTTHTGSYVHLKDAATDPVAAHDLEVISEVEKELSKTPMTYIPGERIKDIEGGIRTGDIICYVASSKGIDITHVVMAVVQDGKVGFMHASMGKMQVVVDPLSIDEYVRRSKSICGIKVVRPL